MTNLMDVLLIAATEGTGDGGSTHSNLWYFLAAYLLLWSAVFVYVLYLHRKMAHLEKTLEEEGEEEDHGSS